MPFGQRNGYNGRLDKKKYGKLKIKNAGVKLIITLAFAAAVVALYACDIGCVFRYFLGIRCPGCGLTRALISLLSLDFALAAETHPLIFVTPVLYLYFLFDGRLLGRRVDECILLGIFLSFFVRWLFLLI